MIKPAVDAAQVAVLLKDYFDPPIREVAPLGTGHIARVFSFHAGGQEYVIRLVTAQMADAFRKEAYIATLLADSDIPLPPILYQGTFQAYPFVITPRAPGMPLDELGPAASEQLVPQMIKMLAAIHQIDISHSQGYGWFDETGVGQLPDWRTFLLQVMAEEDENTFFGQWHRLFTETFLERELFEQVFEEMKGLLRYVPEERYLVHGDYGFNNVLAADGQVTAVLDWANAMFGDFVFDIARLDFFAPGMAYGRRCQEYYNGPGRALSHFAERRRCYLCYTGLNALRFYAKVEQRHSYEWARQRILDVLDASSA